MEEKRSLNWASILARLQEGKTVLANEKKAAVLRATFNRWKKQDLSRAELNLVRQKIGPDEFKLVLIDNKVDAVNLIRKEQRRSAAQRVASDKQQNDKERYLAKRINTAINRIPFKAWDKFFHSVKEIDGFQIALNKAQDTINAFHWWSKKSIDTNGLILVKQRLTPDNFIRFYIAPVT